jgi:hypothetical protein
MKRAFRRLPVLAWVVILGIGVELGAAVVLPAIVVEETYLGWYLSEEQQEAEDRFLRREHVLLPDGTSGWLSAPNWDEGPWRTDSLGSRSTGLHSWTDTSRTRVVALGSSMMNGGMGVSNHETITAALEDFRATSLNFGTMLFGPDQALLMYRSRLSALEPDWVVVGVDNNVEEALTNTYVPLRMRSEANMPFVKPRFEFDGSALSLVPAHPDSLLGRSSRRALIDHIASHDGFFHRLGAFARFEQTPIASAANWTWQKVSNRILGNDPQGLAPGLLQAVLEELESEVRGSGAELIVLLMPPGRDGSGQPGWVEDPYDRRLQELARAGFRVVDGRSAVALSVRDSSPEPVYGPDGVHLTPAGNRLVAQAVAGAIGLLSEDRR